MQQRQGGRRRQRPGRDHVQSRSIQQPAQDQGDAGRDQYSGHDGKDEVLDGVLRVLAGFLRTSGLEFAFNFGFDLDSLGSIDFSGNVNKYLKADQLTSPVSEVIDCNGFYGPNCDPQHELRATQRTTWNYEDLSISLLWRYLGSIERETAQQAATFEPFRQIGSYSYFDLFANYHITDGISVSLGVDNLLDRDAPVVGGEAASTSVNSGNTFPGYYDMLGRTYRASVSLKF